MTTAIISFILSAALAGLLSPLVLSLSKKIHAEQPILGYVDNHKSKAGTPTMGGIIFITAVALSTLVLVPLKSAGTVCVAVTISFGIIGFLDDFIKIKFKKNMGLRPYQKIIAQGLVAIIASAYACSSDVPGKAVNVPFSDITLNLGSIAVFLYLFVIVGATNAVNLTDGLDGLATVTSNVYFTAFTVIMLLTGADGSLVAFSSGLVGATIVFFVLNCFPAKIFMGDTGSLALGGAVSMVAIMSGNVLLLPILGLPFLISAVSVILQVGYFKLSGGKRIFKMAPFHHHLERSGLHENKIVAIYTLASVVLSSICILFV